MPLPHWLAMLNKHLFNKAELRRGVRPVLAHVGRRSGVAYRTPLDAHPVEGGYVFIANYGSGSDWVQNVLAGGSASLTTGGRVVPLVSPRLIPSEQAWRELPAATKPPRVKGLVFLRMDLDDG